MRRSAMVYATVAAMIELSQQRLQGMVLATVRKGWQQSHAGIRLLPGFWGCVELIALLFGRCLPRAPFRMTVPSLVIGLAAPIGLKCSTDAFGRREANAEPQGTANDAASAASANSQEERPSRAAWSRHGTSAPPSFRPHKKTRPWRTGLDFLARKITSKNSQPQHIYRILKVSWTAVFRKRFARPLHKEIEQNDCAIYG